MKALIIGATGATGKDLVNILLQDPFYTAVSVFVRRSVGMVHPKLTEVITDFEKPEEVAVHITGDVLFSCFGTTLKQAGSKQKQFHIDYELPLHFTEIAKRNGVSRTVLLSSHGASAKSRVFYMRVKGQLEDSIEAMGFDQFISFRPGLLLRKDTDRSAERISAGLLKFFNRLGLLRKWRPLPTYILAEKMAKAPKVLGSGKHVIALEKIFSW